ncbi:peptide ABC transporter substrate-binding protein [Marinimicrobium alkaliphilum]|uniref:peptide ABC transporter substrate-binding protein n=1 Tax=Marinimicrobium alkaliphilum TaxID=2202654 RepID=UPI000DBA6246|nr:peptide ABC transporter substrate-binding protein [Marinimicrobium alkaliphilum]
MIKRYFFCVLSTLVVLGLAACSDDQKTPVELGNEQQILHMGNGDEPSDVDPHTTTGIPERNIQVALFEGLVGKDPETLDIVPAAAESWEVSEDGLTYRFQLRENARWSNGDPLTAEDFVWSWRRALLPALGNQYAYSLYSVRNAEAFNRGELDDFSEVGVSALGERELKVELTRPVPYFLELLDHHSMYPVHRATIEAHGREDQRGSRWSRPENFVGNGPFVLKRWVPNQVVVVARNPGYWDAESVHLNEIHFHPVQQPSTEERMYRAGQLHITNTLPEELIPRYRGQDHPALRSFPFYATYYYEFNTQKPPLDDVRVRQALAYSLNREQITDQLLQGGQTPAFHMTPPGAAGYEAEARVPYDPGRARALLAEAGYPGGQNFPSLTLLYNTMESHQRIAVVIQQMWKRELGIDINLRNQDWRVFLASKRSGEHDIARAGWVGDYYDPNTFLDLFVADGGNNDTGWSHARYDELIARAANADDEQQRLNYFQEAEAILMEEVPIIPIYFYYRNHLVAPSVQGWHSNAMDHYSYKGVRLEAQP